MFNKKNLFHIIRTYPIYYVESGGRSCNLRFNVVHVWCDVVQGVCKLEGTVHSLSAVVICQKNASVIRLF